MVFIDFNWTPILIPFVIGIKHFCKLDRSFKILFFFVLSGTITEITGLLTRHLFDAKNTMPISNFYLMVAFALLTWFYIRILNGLIRSSWLWLIVIIFEFGVLINLLIIGSLKVYLFIPQTISKIFFLFYSLAFFHKVMIEAKIKDLWKDEFFLVNIGVLIYYSGNIFFSVLFNIILAYSREFSKITVMYFSALNTIFYLLIAWSMYIHQKKNS